MSGQAKPLFSAHLHHIYKKNLQQREVQPIKHVQDATSHQHPDGIGIKEGQRSLSEMEELLKKRRQRKAEPCIKLLIVEVGSIVGLLFRS